MNFQMDFKAIVFNIMKHHKLSIKKYLLICPVDKCVQRKCYHLNLNFGWAFENLPRLESTLYKQSSVPMRIFTTCEEDHQYPWGYAVSMGEISLIYLYKELLTGTEYPSGTSDTQGYWWSFSEVLWILTGSADMPNGHWWSFSGVLQICFTGTDDLRWFWCQELET